ncbi:type I phosphodiesterase/nucleotide pyrophosphatase [Galbibacter marinus]|uniref:Type I phosphodiesterase/nucleotide pyrophosphatase n=2 Tax=Galbibacter marinus TaxID=555500 RepID=K2QM33_9FLAO|nr:type I phosphodiesterase/nucleotide pyrophosphatase [Galbibacter marinus]
MPFALLCVLLSICGLKAQEKKVVFVIIDGIAEDMLSKANTPNLDEIANVGSLVPAYVGGEKDGYSQTPTISAVGYNTLLTGTWVHKHNVFGNSIKAPNYNYPTVFELFEKRWPEKRTAVFSTWLDNRTKLIGEGLEGTSYLKMDYAFDGFELDTVAFPHDADREFIKNIDEKVATEAARYIKENGPDLSWVYLQFPDDMGHKFGDSPELYEAIAFEDALMGRLWEAISYRKQQFDEDWLLLITTDHGRTAEDGKHHGGQSRRERNIWMITNKDKLNTYAQNHRIAMVDLLPTMVDFLDLEVDEDVRLEWDGVSLLSEVDMINLKGIYNEQNHSIDLSWEQLKGSPKADVYLATSNNKNFGGEDNYKKVGKVKLSKEGYSIDLRDDSVEKFYKVVLKSSNTTLNTWIINE